METRYLRAQVIGLQAQVDYYQTMSTQDALKMLAFEKEIRSLSDRFDQTADRLEKMEQIKSRQIAGLREGNATLGNKLSLANATIANMENLIGSIGEVVLRAGNLSTVPEMLQEYSKLKVFLEEAGF